MLKVHNAQHTQTHSRRTMNHEPRMTKLTKLLRKVGERFWFTHLVIRGASQSNEYINWPLNGQIVIGRGLKHDGILVMDVVGSKPSFGSPRLDWVGGSITPLLIKHDLNIV